MADHPRSSTGDYGLVGGLYHPLADGNVIVLPDQTCLLQSCQKTKKTRAQRFFFGL